MKIISFLLLILLSEAFGGDDDKKSVHFKIHVPEIIKHHIHTKVVFIHVHEMKPDDEKDDKESHVEDWTSYNSYNYGGLEENHMRGYRKQKHKNNMQPYDDYMPLRDDGYYPYPSPYNYENPDDLLVNDPALNDDNGLGMFGPPIDSEERVPGIEAKSSPAPHYAIHEDVVEEPPSNEINYESGYHRGMNSETGRIVHKDHKNFYDNENKQEDFVKEGYENESFNKFQNHGHHGNYDKEIGLEERAGKKRADRRRFIVARMVIR